MKVKRKIEIKDELSPTKIKKEFTDPLDAMAWRTIKCARAQLNLDIVLKCGQSFRWAAFKPQQFIGVLNGKIWILSQTDETLLFKTVSLVKNEPDIKDTDETFLKDYFQLNVDLISLYGAWSKVDPVFKDVSAKFSGVRMLRQDPVENIFSFICSSNNNIKRISGMVESLSTKYGNEVGTIIHDNEPKTFYSFPKLEVLANNSGLEAELRKLGFGYRAGYIAKTAKQLVAAGGYQYLESLRKMPYHEAKTELLKLNGVGPKVADCILLMSLDQPSSVPVDTHMFQIAAQKYLPHLKKYKSVTDKVYNEIGDHFRSLYGDYAGWAHSVLFSSDLKHFQEKIDVKKA